MGPAVYAHKAELGLSNGTRCVVITQDNADGLQRRPGSAAPKTQSNPSQVRASSMVSSSIFS
jgi:hypothetical protein